MWDPSLNALSCVIVNMVIPALQFNNPRKGCSYDGTLPNFAEVCYFLYIGSNGMCVQSFLKQCQYSLMPYFVDWALHQFDPTIQKSLLESTNRILTHTLHLLEVSALDKLSNFK